MTTNDQIEAYLIESELPFEQVREGLWLIHDDVDFIDNVVVYHTPPVITFRVKLMEAPSGAARLPLFSRLLELNATSMVAGAYALEDDSVVVVDTLQSKNLDINELQASIDALALAIREHYSELTRLVEKYQSGAAADGDATAKEAETAGSA